MSSQRCWWLLLGSLLLSSCVLQVDLHPLSGGWKIQTRIEFAKTEKHTLPAVVMDFARGQGLSVDPSLSAEAQVEIGLEALKGRYAPHGITLEWRKQDLGEKIRYRVALSGDSVEQLENLWPGVVHVTPMSDGWLEIDIAPGENNVRAAEEIYEIIRIYGSGFRDHNAPVEQPDFLQWPNPSQIHVQVQPEKRPSLPWIVVGVGVLVVVSVSMVVIRGLYDPGKQSSRAR